MLYEANIPSKISYFLLDWSLPKNCEWFTLGEYKRLLVIDLLDIIIFLLQYVRPGAAPIPASAGVTSSGQVRPPTNIAPMAGRGRGDWRPMGMRNASAAQKGYHQTWGGGNTAGRGLDFTLPSHK